MSERIKAQNGRVALVEYRDHGDDPTAVILSKLNPDTTEFQTQLAGITVGGGGDTPEGLLYALMTALNGLDWKWGATKAAVVLTDASFHDPDLTGNITMGQVAKRTLEIDPVNVYPVVPSFLGDTYAPLAEATSGKVILDEGDSAAALSTALTRIEERPLALLAMEEYSAAVGGTMTYSAASSFAMAGSIASYEWDVNGDGAFEAKTTTPVYEHTYPTAFEGVMQVRVTDSLGGVSSASAKVHVGQPSTRVTVQAPDTVKVSADPAVTDGSQVRLEWEASDPTAKGWLLSLNGVFVGAVTGSTHAATITDVRRSADAEFEVAGVSSTDEVGAAATAVLPAIPEAAPVAPPVTPPKATDPPAAEPANPQPSKPAPSTPTAAPVTNEAPADTALAEGAPVALAGAVERIGVPDEPAAAASPAPISTPGPTDPAAEAAAPPPSPSPSQAPPAAAAPSSPVADLGP